jgi:two-component system response regulator ResD
VSAKKPLILIVDDDEPTQKLLEVLMQRYGFATEIAPDGTQAIERLRQNQYACVILDLMMPTVAGKDVLAFIGEHKQPVKVVICTAAVPVREEDFDPTYVRAIVRKPFDIEQLAATVAALVQ